MNEKQDQQAWTTEFYVSLSGEHPVEEFLDSLDKKTRARFRSSMEQLRIRNVLAREPMVKHLEDKLWELRESGQAGIYRVIYFFFSGRRIVFVHGFQKKTQKTPEKELAIARKRYEDFLRQEQEE